MRLGRDKPKKFTRNAIEHLRRPLRKITTSVRTFVAGGISLLIGLCFLLASQNPVAANSSNSSFKPFTPLSLSELYAKRMRFDRGVPRISVGIMKHQRNITVGGHSPIRLMFDEVNIPKTIYAPAGTKFTFRALKSKKAEKRYWIVVESKKASEDAYPIALKKKWEKRKYKTRIFEAGTIISVRGSVLDTRSSLVAIGGYRSLKAAKALMAKLAQSRSEAETLFIREEMVKPPSGTIGIYDEQGRLRHRAKDSAYIGTLESGKLPVRAVEFGRGYRWHNREDRSYREHMYVVVDGEGALALVNSISAEKLLSGLVPAEIFASAPIEALKAQAVTARGEIFSKLAHRHFGDPYHLCSEQHCQVYAGTKVEQAATNKAVIQTRGLLAARPRKTSRDPIQLIDTRYSSSSGGFSEDNEVVWGTTPSVSLRARLDGPDSDPALAPFKNGLTEKNIRAFVESYPPTWGARSSFANARKYRWTKTLTATAADSMIKHLGVGRMRGLEIIGRGKGGRVVGVRVKGSKGEKTVLRELPVRRLFGNLNSGLFVFDVQRNSGGALRSIKFTGGGWGHGVGMCQMGAIGRAESGQKYSDILSHYYNGAVVVRIY